MRLATLSAAGLVAIVFALPLGAAEPRFAAQFVDGRRMTGAEIHDWHDTKAEPRLDNQKLLVPTDRILWIEDTTQRPAGLPAAFVEFVGGDLLPGRAFEHRTGSETPHRRLPPHLLVTPTIAVDWPDAPRPVIAPVSTRWIKRVVWKKRDDPRYRPGTLFYDDGRQVEFRALRWFSGSVRLLLDEGTRDVAFDQIAELHLPRLDSWDAYLDQLAILVPESIGLVMQVETVDGLRTTTSTGRFQAVTRSGGNPDQWFHALQPAWALEPLWVRHRTIRTRRFFAPHEVPLTAVEPVRAIQKSSLAGGWHAQRDRSVLSRPLRAAGLPFGWGLGVQAYSELAFDLPASARMFKSQLGLDQAAGRGGCVRAAVYVGPLTGTPLFHSPHLIGSVSVLETGRITFPPATGPRQLTLVVDPAHADRPPGADPFEIRDTFDWLQPVVELDPAELQTELRRRGTGIVTAWGDWSINSPDVNGPVISNTWDQTDPQRRRYCVEAVPRDTFFSLSRRISVGSDQRFLCLAVSRFEKETAPSRVQVRIDGRAVSEFEIPIRTTAAETDALLVPVDLHQGKTVLVELIQMAESPASRVEWRDISLISRSGKPPDPGPPTKPDPLADLPPDKRASVEQVETEPARLTALVSELAPAFSTTASDQGVWLFKEFQGRKHVVRTHPPQQGKPCILRGPVAIPSGRRTDLRLSVAAHPESDWQLIVKAGQVNLHEALVSAATAQGGWTDVVVDLSRFAGKNIVLELHNHPNNWSNEFAYWSRIEIVSQ